MKKLWQKNNIPLNSLVEAFETKDDLVVDQKLVKYDVMGSMAHAKMLHKIGILTSQELAELIKGLKEILILDKAGKFVLQLGDEDVHTKIENYLTAIGETGKKIHTGRSRNDQVLTAIRLYSKAELGKVTQELKKLIQSFGEFSKQYAAVPMPGYTHMQKAMPSSISLWATSFKDSFIDDLVLVKTALKLNDQSPLGSGAGYGVPLKLDKQLTAKLLHFHKVQENPVYCQNSRGKIESTILASLVSILLTINKFATDVLLFTTAEFNFFKVSDEFTTGSSIMPQKKNVDVAELLRSKVHLVLGHYVQMISLSSNLTSGFNRDLQDSKKPLLESLEITLQSIKVTQLLLKNISPNISDLKNAMSDELYAVEKTLQLVAKGKTFRDAYLQIGKTYVKDANQ